MRAKILTLVETTAAVFIGYWALPRAEQLWPGIPAPIIDAGTAIFVAVFVAAVSLALWQRPTITVTWKLQDDIAPASDLRLQLRAPGYASGPYQVSFSGAARGGIALLLMSYLRRRALRITVIPVGAPLITTVVRSSRIDENTSVGASDADNGFSMRVTTKPRPQTWMWAKVYFKSDTTVNDTFAVDYATTASTKPAELLSKLIRVSSKVEDLIIY